METIISLELPDVKLFRKGKVRDVYDLGEELLFLASDRISAFDVVMPNGIPDKGKVLNMISVFWFDLTKDIIDNHMVTVDVGEIVAKYNNLAPYKDKLEGRSMLVKKAEPIMCECIVRGYISGSGWKDYQKTGEICGIKLPEGLKQSAKLADPIFTPSTKADNAHDINISEEDLKKEIGEELIDLLKEKSIALYEKASEYAALKGIIIADTKFEFGKIGDKVILMDEVLTPDSSRFWPKDDYESGRAQKSFDKQFVRDYLESLDWDKTPPGPELPEGIVNKTREKYLQAYKTITGKDLNSA
ncbi:MAG: phosphoribosylaminoimidazolesuccinocarboxamide synthase [Candidatus Omnitrophica bacterium]|nr:phosphoribosylaminoimidazolesuccinocarboxamide synthase [Candidatus Omnitrophota bacterium]